MSSHRSDKVSSTSQDFVSMKPGAVKIVSRKVFLSRKRAVTGVRSHRSDKVSSSQDFASVKHGAVKKDTGSPRSDKVSSASHDFVSMKQGAVKKDTSRKVFLSRKRGAVKICFLTLLGLMGTVRSAKPPAHRQCVCIKGDVESNYSRSRTITIEEFEETEPTLNSKNFKLWEEIQSDIGILLGETVPIQINNGTIDEVGYTGRTTSANHLRWSRLVEIDCQKGRDDPDVRVGDPVGDLVRESWLRDWTIMYARVCTNDGIHHWLELGLVWNNDRRRLRRQVEIVAIHFGKRVGCNRYDSCVVTLTEYRGRSNDQLQSHATRFKWYQVANQVDAYTFLDRFCRFIRDSNYGYSVCGCWTKIICGFAPPRANCIFTLQCKLGMLDMKYNAKLSCTKAAMKWFGKPAIMAAQGQLDVYQAFGRLIMKGAEKLYNMFAKSSDDFELDLTDKSNYYVPNLPPAAEIEMMEMGTGTGIMIKR